MTPKQFTKIRINRGLSINQYASLLGVSYRSIYRYERGERKVPLTVIKLLEVTEELL